MQLHKMNKRGIFLPLFAVATLLILSALLVIMINEANNRNDNIGAKAIHLVNLYYESEKTNFYLDLAANYSSENAIAVLGANGGYSDTSRCEKIEKTVIQKEYVIWNSCPMLNPQEEFKEQLKKEIKKYIEIYETDYKLTTINRNLENGFLGYKEINNNYTDEIRKTQIESIESKGNELIINFTKIKYKVEETKDAYLTTSPRTKISKPDLSIYKKIYLLVANNCINKDFKTCSEVLKKEISGVDLSQESSLIKISVPIKEGQINFAINPNKPIPQYTMTLDGI